MRCPPLLACLFGAALPALGPSPAIAKICNPAGFCIEHPSPVGHDLWGVWAARPDRFYVVGSHGTALRWDGAQVEGSFGLAGGAALRAVFGVASGGGETVFAVGDAGTALRFDGRSWQPLPTGSRANLVAVWASDAAHVLATGTDGTLLRFDGQAWRAIPCGTKEHLDSVHGWGRTRAFISGRHGTLLQYDGTSCTPVKHGVGGRLSFGGVYGDRPDQVMVVGTPTLRFDGKTWKEDPSSELMSEGLTGSPGSPLLSWRFDRTLRHDGKTWTPFWSGHPTVHAWAIPRPGTALGVGGGGLVVSVDERGFTRHSSSQPQAGWHFGVWGSGPDQVFVTDSAGILWRWNGSAWAAENSGCKQRLMAIHGSDPQHAFAVGDNGTIVRYNGKTWTAQASGTHADLRAVYTAGPQSAWAVGSRGTIVHFDGTAFRPETSGTDADLSGIWGSGPGNVYAVGQGGTVLRFDGRAWRAVTTGVGDDHELSSVWGSGAADVFVVGAQYPDQVGVVLHWNGASWTRTTVPARQLHTIWGAGPKDVLVGGQAPAEEGGGINGILLRFDGQRWKRLLPRERENMQVQLGIWGVRAAGDRVGQAWFVGQNSQIAHFDGTGFGFRTPGTTASLEALWGSPEALYAVSSSGDILRGGAQGWQALESPTTRSLYALWGSGPKNIYAAGYGGVLLQSDGTRFRPISAGLPTEPALYALWGSAPNDVFVAGENGAIAHFDGQRFQAIKTGNTASLHALFGTGPRDVWAGGEGGTLLHFDGTAWQPVPSQTTEGIYGLWGNSPTQIYAATASCSILQWNGSAWQEAHRRTTAECRSPRPSEAPRYFHRQAQIWGSTTPAGPRIYVLREAGTLAVSDGKTWTEQDLGMSGLRGLWGTPGANGAPPTLHLSGESATLLRHPPS
ncbi:MAG TPA: hypothetical protein PKI03_01480 [Pseudomonadota bacterium]|nr:hypothetical protein [Pseudomonadota bacterium]